MSRLYLLLIFGIWMIGSASLSSWKLAASTGVAVFLSGYVILVTVASIWARMLCRQLDSARLYHSLRRFNRGLSIARGMVPAWLAVSLFGPCAWGDWVSHLLTPWSALNIRCPADQPQLFLTLPGLLLGTLPAMLAWMGLWWAQFPADRALREQTMLDQLDADLPTHSAPGFWRYFTANFRVQVLFILMPVVLILGLRDAALGIVAAGGWHISNPAALENWVMMPAAVTVFVFAPELLRRVLHTQPLPPSALRQRLELICRKLGLRYRQILLWQTQYSMGNAAVMGLLPQLRYIMLSDLLLETLSDEQIESVLAHEAGHIVHRHMMWYAVFFITITLAILGPGRYLEDWQLAQHLTGRMALIRDALMGLAGMAVIIAIFGFISRRFERQADVFAARMMQSHVQPQTDAAGPLPAWTTPVGPHGAQLFASALHRVAIVNNIPIAARSWCHGSIAKRMNYVQDLAGDPGRTEYFDRTMSWLYATLVLVAAGCAAIVALG